MPIKDDSILFRVPIYTTSRSEFNEDLYEDLKQEQERKKHEIAEQLKELNEDVGLDEYLEKYPVSLNRESICWKYNMFIRWIEFYSHFRKIKADLWLTTKERVPKKIGKPEIDYCPSKRVDLISIQYHSNEEIRERIRTFLQEVQEGAYGWNLGERFIDVSWLDRLEYLDIKGMVEDSLEE